MKYLFAILLTLSCLPTAHAGSYDCDENNNMTYSASGRTVTVYEFGGADLDCNRIALKLNLQVIANGQPKAFDCNCPSYPYVTVKSEFGNVVTMVEGNFICEKLALSLRSSL